ncbi:MAG: hypothetical protein ACRELE_02010 [Gemmatimonadales bacterium]
MDRVSLEVIGIVPRDFTLGGSEDMRTPMYDLAPAMTTPEISRKPHDLRVITRLKPGTTIAIVHSDLQAIARRLERLYPDANTGRRATVLPLRTAMPGDVRPALR